MNRYHKIGTFMAALSWLVILMQWAFYVRFGALSAWLDIATLQHGSTEQVLLLAWLLIMVICFYLGGD